MCVLVLLGLTPAAASAGRLRLATPATTVRPAVSDGQRWVAWTVHPGQIGVIDVQRSAQQSIDQPGCYTDAIASGRLLINCASPSPGPRVLNLVNGSVYGPAPGQAPDYSSGFDPVNDSFGEIGRYWLSGFRMSPDPHVQGRPVYLNLRDGHTSQVDGPRDLDSVGLDRLAHHRCATPSGPTPRYRLVFGPLGAGHPLRLLTCASGKTRVISRCPRGCQSTGPNLDPKVLVWLQGRSAVHTISPANNTRHAWLLSPPASRNPPYVQATTTAGRLFVSKPTMQADGSTGWRIYTAPLSR